MLSYQLELVIFTLQVNLYVRAFTVVCRDCIARTMLLYVVVVVMLCVGLS